LSEGIGQGQITGLASALAIIIVGLPIYVFHWLMAQRLAGQDEAERASLIRRLYFYAMMAGWRRRWSREAGPRRESGTGKRK
jgi:hypothetical protein